MSNEIITTVQDSTPTEKGVSTSNGGGGGWKIIAIDDAQEQQIIPEDQTIYILRGGYIIFIMPATAKLGFSFQVISVSKGFRIRISPGSNQTLRFLGIEGANDVYTDHYYDDAKIICVEENKRFKWLCWYALK